MIGPAGGGTKAGRGGRPSRVVAVVAALTALAVAAAVGYWALAVYDPGPDLAASSVAELQVADGGWASVDLDGAAHAEISSFLVALDEARALWPPRLLFE